MIARIGKLSAVLGNLFLLASCLNPLLEKVTKAVEVARGPQITVIANATTCQDGGTIDFGSVYIFSTSTNTFTIKNTGKADLILSGGAASVAVSGTNADQFTLSTPPSLATIPVGESATFALAFSPTRADARTATVTVESNDPSTATFTFTVTGTGVNNGSVARPTFSPGQGVVRPEQTVAILCTTKDATIFYTTDGSDPLVSTSQVFSSSSPVALSEGTTLRAMGVKAGMADSAIATALYLVNTDAASIPEIKSADSGNAMVTVTWADATKETVYHLYYTNGTTVPADPADCMEIDIPYDTTSAIVIDLYEGTQYAFAVAAYNGYGESPRSDVLTAYTYCGAPTNVVATGGDQQATVTWTAMTGATSYDVYWEKGTTVTTTSGTKVPNAVSPLVVTGLEEAMQYAFIVTAVGVAGEGPSSGTITATTLTHAAAPSFSPDGATYTSSQTVTISTTTSGASIRYTTDGSNPSESVGTVYTEPVSVTASTTLKAVAYGEGLAPSTITTATYLIPGSTWTARTLPLSDNWNSVAFGNGVFAAVASFSTSAASSPDGINWTARTLPYGHWHVVTYGNGRFVTISASGGKSAASSDNGVTWQEGSLPSTSYWYALAYGNGIFVAIARGTAEAAISTDGISWTSHAMGASRPWTSLTFGNGVFVTVASGSKNSAVSTDGITWTLAETLPSTYSWQSVTFGNNIFVAVAQNSAISASSTDGANWAPGDLPSPAANWYAVGYGDGVFVAVTTSTNNRAATSIDGITWTARTLPSSASWLSVVYGNERFVAVSSNTSNKAATSP